MAKYFNESKQLSAEKRNLVESVLLEDFSYLVT